MISPLAVHIGNLSAKCWTNDLTKYNPTSVSHPGSWHLAQFCIYPRMKLFEFFCPKVRSLKADESSSLNFKLMTNGP